MDKSIEQKMVRMKALTEEKNLLDDQMGDIEFARANAHTVEITIQSSRRDLRLAITEEMTMAVCDHILMILSRRRQQLLLDAEDLMK